jgi:predicted GNAT superfamily acetyltransferase
MPCELRDIADLDGCRAVVEVQGEVWGRDAEIVPASVLIASAKRGGILIGAFDGDRLAGFVWSMPGWRKGRRTQWSHMLAVRPADRGSRVGESLKRAQYQRARGASVELIEWTFDPLQAQNAHLNLSVLACTASEYRENAYGELAGPLHHGTPTDRLVAEWWVRDVPNASRQPRNYVSSATVISTQPSGAWIASGAVELDADAAAILVPVPPQFGEMQARAKELAMGWRLATRKAFMAYFNRGYRAVDFVIDRDTGGGKYVLQRSI